MVIRFSELERLAIELLETFDSNEGKLHTDMKDQIKALGAYQEEVAAIRTLQRRLDLQRKMVEMYKARLEKVQEKMNEQKAMEVLWRQRASRRCSFRALSI